MAGNGGTRRLGVSQEIPAEVVRRELDRIFDSPDFRASKRSQDFLRYVVEARLSGHAQELKERTIGIEVFGRPASYDPAIDATVRVKAGEIRKRLGLYYIGPGAADEVRIDLPAGGYVPEFSWVSANGGSQPAQPPRVLRRWPLVLPLGGALLAAVFLWVQFHSADAVIDRFWRPALRSRTPVLLCVSYVPVYGLDLELEVRSLPPSRVEDLNLLPDSFVGGGDLLAVSHISTLLSRKGLRPQVKIGNDVSFHDLRASPSVLIGYSYTRWKELSRGLRFLIDTSHRPPGVTDNGRNTAWSLPHLRPDRHADEDYALVSRFLQPDTGTMLLVVSGITQYGTEAASDLVTNPDLLAQALREAPSDWPRKNLQLVLHVKVISGEPGSPQVVASHFW